MAKKLDSTPHPIDGWSEESMAKEAENSKKTIEQAVEESLAAAEKVAERRKGVLSRSQEVVDYEDLLADRAEKQGEGRLDSMRDQFAELIKDMPEFETCAWYHPEMDEITFLTRDCSYVAENDPNSSIQLLRDNANGEIVGFHIECPAKWMKHCKEK